MAGVANGGPIEFHFSTQGDTASLPQEYLDGGNPTIAVGETIFLRAHTVPGDCNGSGIPDECEAPVICRSPEELTAGCVIGQDADPQGFEVWNCGFAGSALACEISVEDECPPVPCPPVPCESSCAIVVDGGHEAANQSIKLLGRRSRCGHAALQTGVART